MLLTGMRGPIISPGPIGGPAMGGPDTGGPGLKYLVLGGPSMPGIGELNRGGRPIMSDISLRCGCGGPGSPGAVAMLVGGAPLSGGPGAGCDDGGLAGKYWIVLGALAWI